MPDEHRSQGAQVPPELITQIVHYAFQTRILSYSSAEDAFFGAHSDPSISTLEQMITLQKKISSLLRVNRTWHNALFLLLYRQPVVVSPRALYCFLRTCRFRPEVLPSLAVVNLVDLPEEVDAESVYGLAAPGGTSIPPVSDMLAQLCAMKGVKLLSFVFVTRNWPLLRDGASERELLNPSPAEVQTVSVTRSKALDQVQSLTLHGYPSHVLLSGSTHLLNLHSLSLHSLRHLTLHHMSIGAADALGWPSMPALASLTITSCTLRAISPPNVVPSLEHAPNLHTLAIMTLHPIMIGVDDETITLPLIASILQHGHKIISLTVPSFMYSVLKRDAESSEAWSWKRRFPELRELATAKARTRENTAVIASGNQEPWTKGILSKLAPLPPSFALLRVVGIYPCLWEVYIIFDSAQVGRVLAPARILERDYRWVGLRIAGDTRFWDQVPNSVLSDASQACAQQKRAFVDFVHKEAAGVFIVLF
jgi:hypothetical protein